jgi:hypothetical protein
VGTVYFLLVPMVVRLCFLPHLKCGGWFTTQDPNGIQRLLHSVVWGESITLLVYSLVSARRWTLLVFRGTNDMSVHPQLGVVARTPLAIIIIAVPDRLVVP